MEVFVGMILLLQVVMSIQIMLTKKQVLQKIEEQTEKIEVFLENVMPIQVQEDNTQLEVSKSDEIGNNMECRQQEKRQRNGENTKMEQEELLNEVLSKVFS